MKTLVEEGNEHVEVPGQEQPTWEQIAVELEAVLQPQDQLPLGQFGKLITCENCGAPAPLGGGLCCPCRAALYSDEEVPNVA